VPGRQAPVEDLGVLRIMPGELVERGCAKVIVTTDLELLIVIALPRAAIERRSRA
jgi:hypothetical protein